ncbi:MAG: glycosyltransferase [Candidatus Lokiarchaeota archaeon]|nr:glycosyltransferase [Candidatus Lokiarchaeota archaeon]
MEKNYRELKEEPLINIIVPAWNEGDEFAETLSAIKNLSYPHLKVFINVGGNDKTIKIGTSFQNDNRFEILYQKRGEGKNKAINECLKKVTEGLIYIIDADIILTDDIFYYMIYYLIDKDYDIIVSSIYPHHSISEKNIVKYLCIYRNREFWKPYSPNKIQNLLGVNFCFNLKVLREIRQFPEGKLQDDNAANASVLNTKNFKFFHLYNKRAESFTFPTKLKVSMNQNIRYLQNSWMYNLKQHNFFIIIKLITSLIISIYLLVFPLFLFLHINFFILGIIILLSQYITRLRAYTFYLKTNQINYRIKISKNFFLALIFFIYIDAINRILAFIELIFMRDKYKQRKNLTDK